MTEINCNSCRICLKVQGFISVFDKLGDNIIADSILFVTNVKINQSDVYNNVPEKICGNCLQNICAARKLKEQCQESDQVIKVRFGIEEQNNASETFIEADIFEPEFHALPTITTDIKEEDAKLTDSDDSRTSIKGEIFDEEPFIVEMKSPAKPPQEKLIKPKEVPIKSSNKFYCRYCFRNFMDKSKLRRHENFNHKNAKTYICDLCGSTFISKIYVKEHINVHHLKMKLFKCEICGFPSYANSIYLDHKKSHDSSDNSKTFACSYCDKKFSRKYNRNVHERLHTLEKPFNCDHCPKSFAQPTTYKRHLLQHTENWPYTCKFCHKGFTLRSYLNEHEERHQNGGLRFTRRRKIGLLSETKKSQI